jgi:hypothetical protein
MITKIFLHPWCDISHKRMPTKACVHATIRTSRWCRPKASEAARLATSHQESKGDTPIDAASKHATPTAAEGRHD